ncbi:hypothetical protein L1887_49084 [Cichorium endivia]|nr:hypothetical protein L1887_49084 [Cichorium endivia]
MDDKKESSSQSRASDRAKGERPKRSVKNEGSKVAPRWAALSGQQLGSAFSASGAERGSEGASERSGCVRVFGQKRALDRRRRHRSNWSRKEGDGLGCAAKNELRLGQLGCRLSQTRCHSLDSQSNNLILCSSGCGKCATEGDPEMRAAPPLLLVEAQSTLKAPALSTMAAAMASGSSSSSANAGPSDAKKLAITSQLMSGFKPAKVFTQYTGKGTSITSASFDDTGAFCVTTGQDDQMHLYDVRTGMHKSTVHERRSGSCVLAARTARRSVAVHAIRSAQQPKPACWADDLDVRALLVGARGVATGVVGPSVCLKKRLNSEQEEKTRAVSGGTCTFPPSVQRSAAQPSQRSNERRVEASPDRQRLGVLAGGPPLLQGLIRFHHLTLPHSSTTAPRATRLL